MKAKKKVSDLQRAFVQGMEQVMRKGVDFNALLHETLNDLLGEWASREFFSSTVTYSTTPEIFSEAAKRAFPERTLTLVFNMVAKRAEALVSESSYSGKSDFQGLLRDLHNQMVALPKGRKLVPLHDHRAEDELDKLVGHKTT